MCFQIVFEFCSLQVASQPGDCKCVFKLSSNSVILNFVRFKLPAIAECGFLRFKLPVKIECNFQS